MGVGAAAGVDAERGGARGAPSGVSALCMWCELSQEGAGTRGAARAFSAPSDSALRRERARGARRCGAALERRVRGSGEGGDPGEGRWYL